MIKIAKKWVFGILAFLFCLNILAWAVVYDLSKPQLLEVNFFDVGQGDAIFIETPYHHQILIDGGPGSTILEKLSGEISFWDRTLDLIILTHPEHDHLGGLIEVLKKYKVENILWTGVLRDTAEYQVWQKLIQEEKAKEGAKIEIAQAGQKITSAGSNLAARKIFIEILYPFENLEGKKVKNTNNTSIILRLISEEHSFFFTGDAYKSVERKLIKSGQEIDSDVLKVGHHGSKTSSDEEFIQAVSPEIAVIQCGRDNPYGHPYPETLETFKKYDIEVLRTDINGDIKIFSDGKKLEIKTKL